MSVKDSGTSIAGRAFHVTTMLIALAIGALQMFHVRGGVLTDYGADVFGTAWFYGMFRQGRTLFQRKRGMSAAATAVFVFCGCAAFEFAQAWRLFPGTFDPVDLVAFAAAVAACYAVDLQLDLS